jgi:hypothetical protein
MDVNMIMNIVKYDTNKRWVIHDFLEKIPLKKMGNPYSTPKGI